MRPVLPISSSINGELWPNLGAYYRYIDDILVVWQRTMATLNEFIEQINRNKYGMKFTTNIHDKHGDFLDLHIFKDDFKSTDRNGYITIGSCPQPQWKTMEGPMYSDTQKLFSL